MFSMHGVLTIAPIRLYGVTLKHGDVSTSLNNPARTDHVSSLHCPEGRK
jgi:hypothetical protein